MTTNPLFEKYGRTVEAGHVIFTEGEPGNYMYIIQQGSVRITKNIGGKEHVLAELSKGDFFGEMAIVSKIERTATAIAVDSVQLLVFDRNGFQSMIEKNAKIAMNVIDKLCRRLQNANSQIQFLFKRNERSLIALNLYCKFMEKPADEQFLAYDKTVEDISFNLEVPAASVQNSLKEFAESGIVLVNANAIRLKDRQKLNALADRAGAKS
ncbi:MAG: Crp/Fnr family transcriptional regulator [Spirochaetaceae bacterium]|nr:MAG: Crp/Fnr family transcriptional regulator [Spirochaetaceae bacterium]